MKKTKVKVNNPVYLGISIFDITKTLLYDFWYDYINQSINAKQNYVIWTLTALLFICKLNIFMEILQMMFKKYDASNFQVDRQLPKGMNKKVIGLMKDELRGKIITEFVTLRLKRYFYLTDDDKNVKKAKGTKECVIKRILKLNDYKNCLFKNEIILKPRQRWSTKWSTLCIYWRSQKDCTK